MCGVGTAVLVAGSARVGRGRALSLCSPCAATAHAGLSSGFVVATPGFGGTARRGVGGCLNASVFLEIGSHGFFDHTRYFLVLTPSRVCTTEPPW